MSRETLKFVFAGAVSAMAARAGNISLRDQLREVCRAFAIGFGLDEVDGDNIYTNGILQNDVTTINGFGPSSFFEEYESNIQTILNSYSRTSSLTSLQRQKLAAVVNSIIFGYVGNSNIPIQDLYIPIGNTLFQFGDLVLGTQVFEKTEAEEGVPSVVVHPFTESVIKSLLLQNDYSLTYREISTSSKPVEVDLVHYNWYDTSSIFAGPELDKIKDAENQYYYLSGNLSYDGIPSGFQFCDEQQVLISTPTGQKVITIVRNSPCVDNNSYIGPITGVKFYRAFNDGPYSSGDFTESVKKEYINFDKKKLSSNQYQSNYSSIYSFLTGESGQYVQVFSNGVRFDAEGEYNLSGEYLYAPISTGIYPKYQIMHVGDASVRSQCANGDCTNGVEKMVTGFKYALLEMDPNIWEDRYAYIRTNPPVSSSNLIRRSLNLSTGTYISTLVSGELVAAYHDPVQGHIWYVGPPQLNQSQLPYFAFTQSFQSVTFPNKASITLYPAIGASNSSITGDSTRSFSVSPITLVSASDLSFSTVQTQYESNVYPKTTFNVTLPSFRTDDDDIKKKVFGMGDFFSGKYPNISYSREENAGYIYTGILFDGYTGSHWDLINSYEAYKVGSPYDTIKYISGYTGPTEISVSKLIGHDNLGNNKEYYYFDESLLPSDVTIQTTGLSTLGELPTGLEANSSYSRKYEIQEVENQRQRYYRGPYAVYNNKFLYPNALTESKVYQEINGFPRKFRYKIRVREETVKELYCKFKISQGFSYETPTFVSIVRPTGGNFGVPNPVMGNIFSNSTYSFDFNQWDINKRGFFYNLPLPGGVDNNYAPFTDSYFDIKTHYIAASGKNAQTYINEAEFQQGILITGKETSLHRSYSGNLYRQSGKDWFTILPAAVGLYHGFTGYDISGELTYNKPIFNLEEGIIDRVRVLEAMPAFKSGCVSYKFCNVGCTESRASGINNLYTKQLDGRTFYSKSGQDPFFFKDMGGRVGNNASNEGGYHPKEIVGDNWIGLSAQTYGYYCSVNGDVCNDDPEASIENLYGVEARMNSNRVASDDRRWFFIEATPETTKIHTRALDYNPLAFNYKNNPFTSKSIIPSSSSKINLNFENTLKSFKFDLSSYFPKRTVTEINEWYVNPSGSGLVLGPFDRDVELFVDSNRTLTGYNSLFINLRQMSDFSGGVDDGTYLTCGVPKVISGSDIDYGYGAFRNIRPLIYVPSGESAIFNFRGTTTGYVGADTNSYVSIRARYVLNETTLDDSELAWVGIKGSNFWMHNHNFINNGSERTYTINTPNFDIQNLEGSKYSYITFARTGVIFPKPDTTEFITYKVDDAAGNETYSIEDMEDFYKKKTAKENSTIYYSGWREGSRVSFEFVEVTPLMDELPYEHHKILIPSGNCILNGEYGYLGQADNAIFTEGVYLVDETPNDKIKEQIYGPNFVSQVLKRVPQFSYPTGNAVNPILEAPSVFKQRAGTGYVTPESTFSGLLTSSPENYNKLLWPALSDLRILNPDETLEDLPPDDGATFLNSNILISASQGQSLPNGKFNPNSKKVYSVREQYQLYDTVATDAIINSGTFLTNRRGTEVQLIQPTSGVLVPIGTTLTEIINELI